MTWQTLETTARGGVAPNPDPALRIITRRSGYLNVAARRALAYPGVDIRIIFQVADDGRISIKAVEDGILVSKDGRVTVTSLTSAVEGPIPITLELSPSDEPGRLIVTGVTS